MRIRVRTDLAGVSDAVARANEAALGVTAENALSDTEPYVPYETGELRESGEARVAGDRAYLEYGGNASREYARIQYYNALNHETAQNAVHAPKASDHWVERSQADNGDRWARIHGREMGRHLR